MLWFSSFIKSENLHGSCEEDDLVFWMQPQHRAQKQTGRISDSYFCWFLSCGGKKEERISWSAEAGRQTFTPQAEGSSSKASEDFRICSKVLLAAQRFVKAHRGSFTYSQEAAEDLWRRALTSFMSCLTFCPFSSVFGNNLNFQKWCSNRSKSCWKVFAWSSCYSADIGSCFYN